MNSFQSMKAIDLSFRTESGTKTLLNVLQHLNGDILGIHWTHSKNDRLGVDAVLEYSDCRLSKVDFKFRRETTIPEWIILETWSNLEAGVKGWASQQSKADQFVFVQFKNDGSIISVLAVKSKAISDLINHRYDDLVNSGIVRRSASSGERGQWQGEFIAIKPDELMKLLQTNEYRFLDFMAKGGDL